MKDIKYGAYAPLVSILRANLLVTAKVIAKTGINYVRCRGRDTLPLSAEAGRAAQESLHKLDLWFGRTLWGRFVRDDRIALDYLCSRPEVDGTRIGATGNPSEPFGVSGVRLMFKPPSVDP